jgi:hypothetical protein
MAPLRHAFASTHTKFDRAKIKRGVDLISDALPFRRSGTATRTTLSNMQGFSVDHDAIIRVYDGAETPTSIPLLKGGTL